MWLKGAITLEYLMNVREAPFPNTCDVVGELLFNPRMVHSRWGLDQFPDPHLSAIAHAGMDAILVFVEGVDRTPDNRITRVSRIAHRLRAPSRSPVAGPPGRPTRPGRTAPQPRHRHRVLDVQLGYPPEEDRIALIQRLPPRRDTVVTFEMFEPCTTTA